MTPRFRATDLAGTSGAVFDSAAFDTNAFDANSWEFGEEAEVLIGAYRGLYMGIYEILYLRS
jgi:hypothetical protein